LKTNTWYHVAVTFESGLVSIYINGSLDNSGNIELTALPNRGSRVLRFGDDQPGGQEYFNGSIDDIRIYKRALSESEIQQLYFGGSNKPPAL
jgi:hypothetical protein